MAIWPAVHGLKDGDPVNADTLNRPYFELAERTNYLYNRLNELAGQYPYESIRIYNAPLSTDSRFAPNVKDIVRLLPDNTYGKAIAAMSLLDEFTSSDTSWAIGVLISKNGSTGTILLNGRLSSESLDGLWPISDLLEDGDVVRDGPYYLSNKVPGKLTSTPSIPIVYVGFFIEDKNNAGYLKDAIINIHYRDTGLSHIHRSYKLYSQPAGRFVVTAEDPNGINYIIGFKTVAVEAEQISEGDQIPRLVIFGDWSSSTPTQYTIWLSNATGTDPNTSSPPSSFSDAYLHWKSNNPEEGQGMSRVWSFEKPVPIGKFGLYAVLENSTEVDPHNCTDWDILYSVSEDNINKRKWVIDVPVDVRGWLANYTRQTFQSKASINGKFTFLLFGGPVNYSDKRISDNITLRCAEVHSFTMSLPSHFDKTIIGDLVFQYTQTGEVESNNYIAVPIDGSTENPLPTYENLLEAILSVDQNITPIIDEESGKFIIGTPPNTTVEHLGETITPSTTGAGDIVLGSASLLVYDSRHRNMVLSESSLYWYGVKIWEPIQLRNNLMIIPVPFSDIGEPMTNSSILNGDYWECPTVNYAPGAAFKYAIGVHHELKEYYPPIPIASATLVLNGVELDGSVFFSSRSTYTIAQDTLYWHRNQYERVPWPKTWINATTPVEEYLDQKLVFHFVRHPGKMTGYVTSLQSAPNSPIKVYKCGTNEEASTGDLAIDLDLVLSTDDMNLAGYQVVKTTVGNRLKRGPVVEKIIAGRGLTVTQSAGAPPGQGVVTLSLSEGDSVYTGDFEEVALENAKQELIGMFPYVRLLGWRTGGSNIPSGFVAKFRVPHTLLDAYYRVVVYATVFGEANIPATQEGSILYAGIVFDYSILPDVNPIGVDIGAGVPPTNSLNLMENLLKPVSPKQTAIPFGIPNNDPIYKAYDPILIHNYANEPNGNLVGHKAQVLGLPFPSMGDMPSWPHGDNRLGVRPGSLVAVRFRRGNVENPDIEYTGSIGFINLRWMLISID